MTVQQQQQHRGEAEAATEGGSSDVSPIVARMLLSPRIILLPSLAISPLGKKERDEGDFEKR